MKRQAADADVHRPTPERDVPLQADRSNTGEQSPLRRLRIMQALLATTWRIAVPVVMGTGLGIFLDLKLGRAPWLTLLGVTLGFVLAGVLIARLIKETENE